MPARCGRSGRARPKASRASSSCGGASWARTAPPPGTRSICRSAPTACAAGFPAAGLRPYVVRWRLRIELGRRRLIAYEGGRERLRLTVAVGRPGTPTPTGSFYVLERLYLTDPRGPYGPGALGLSSFSPVLTGWTRGGPVAIHGTNERRHRRRRRLERLRPRAQRADADACCATSRRARRSRSSPESQAVLDPGGTRRRSAGGHDLERRGRHAGQLAVELERAAARSGSTCTAPRAQHRHLARARGACRGRAAGG